MYIYLHIPKDRVWIAANQFTDPAAGGVLCVRRLMCPAHVCSARRAPPVRLSHFQHLWHRKFRRAPQFHTTPWHARSICVLNIAIVTVAK